MEPNGKFKPFSIQISSSNREIGASGAERRTAKSRSPFLIHDLTIFIGHFLL
jgi:hypothetical protein